MGTFMGLVRRAFWTTNGCYGTALWWVKCKRLRNAQIKFPWKHSRASKMTGEKHSGHVYLRLYISLSLSLLRSADFIFLSQTLLRVTSSLVVSMLSGQIVINPGSFWVAYPGISRVSAPSEWAFPSDICFQCGKGMKPTNSSKSAWSSWHLEIYHQDMETNVWGGVSKTDKSLFYNSENTVWERRMQGKLISQDPKSLRRCLWKTLTHLQASDTS